MEIKNIKNNNKGLNYYKTDEFATIDIRQYFNYENNKENFIKSLLLRNYLLKTNNKYKTHKQIIDKSRELYGLKVIISNYNFGIKSIICFELKMVNPRIIEENYFNDALNFYKDIMLKPNFIDNKLDKKIFNQIKKELIDRERNNIKNPSILSERLYYKNVLPNSIINNQIITDINEFENIVNNINDNDIIDFYNKLMESYISSLAFGNLLDEEIKLIENSFNFSPINFDYKYDKKEKVSKEDIEVISKETSQSNIYFTYEIKNFKKENRYLYEVLMTMLNNSNGPIYNTYRTKLGIMYSGYAITLYKQGVIYIKVDIDKNNKDKAINGLKEIFDILNDKKELNKLLEFAKEKAKEISISNSENLTASINEIENYIFKLDFSTDKKLKLTNKLTMEDIIKQIENLEYKGTYFYKGDKDEK